MTPRRFESYVRHAVLFGDELIVETVFRDPECEAAQQLRAEIALALKQTGTKQPRSSRRRPTTDALRVQVLQLHERGVVTTAIADALNISDRRVRELLRDAGYGRNRHRNPFDRAEKTADTRFGQVT